MKTDWTDCNGCYPHPAHVAGECEYCACGCEAAPPTPIFDGTPELNSRVLADLAVTEPSGPGRELAASRVFALVLADEARKKVGHRFDDGRIGPWVKEVARLVENTLRFAITQMSFECGRTRNHLDALVAVMQTIPVGPKTFDTADFADVATPGWEDVLLEVHRVLVFGEKPPEARPQSSWNQPNLQNIPRPKPLNTPIQGLATDLSARFGATLFGGLTGCGACAGERGRPHDLHCPRRTS